MLHSSQVVVKNAVCEMRVFYVIVGTEATEDLTGPLGSQ